MQPEVQQFLGKNNNSPNLWRIAWDIQGNQRIWANLLLFRHAAARLCEGSNFPVLSYDFTHSPILLLHEGGRKSVAFFFSDAATEFFGLLFDIAPAERGQRGSRNRTVEKRSIPESLPPLGPPTKERFLPPYPLQAVAANAAPKKSQNFQQLLLLRRVIMIMTFLSANGVYGAGEKPDVWGVKKSLFSFSFMEKRLGGNGIGFEASSSGSNRLNFGLYFPVRDCSPTSYIIRVTMRNSTAFIVGSVKEKRRVIPSLVKMDCCPKPRNVHKRKVRLTSLWT